MPDFQSADDLKAAVGTHLGYSDWLEIDQERIDQFADATGDHQWIHVDPERAKDGPFGTTIAHGYLTLSITNMFLPAAPDGLDARSSGINYGANKVRFPAPVPVGSRIRVGGEIIEVDDVRRRRAGDRRGSPSRSKAATSRPASSRAISRWMFD